MALQPTKKTKEAPSDSGMLTSLGQAAPPSAQAGSTAPSGMMYAGGTPNFDERTGQTTGTTKGEPTKQAPIVTADSAPAPAPAPEPEAEMTFTFVEGKERGGAAQEYLYGQEGEVQQLTVDELREYFESDKVNRLPEVFGTFENYLAYMTEREQLIQSGDYDVGNWSEADAGFTEDQEMILEGDADLTIDPSDPGQNLENLRRQQTSTQQGAYNNWINSEANQALLQKYGVNPVVYSNSGDKFAWNGSAYVKVVDEDHAGLADFVKMGLTAAIGIMSGGALAPALGGIGSAVVSNALTQAITTGSIDPEQLLQTAATAGLGQAVSQIIGPEIKSALGGIDLSEITGIEEVDNVLNAMGQTAIRQAVFDGELDMDQIISSGLFAGAQELASFILEPIQQFIAENTTASPEAMEELARRQAELRDGLNQEAFEEITSNMNDTLNTAIAEQQNAAIANQLRDLSGNLQSIYEEAYAVSPQPSGPSVDDFMANSVDDADSELADTTADLTADTTAQPEPMAQITNPFEGDELINGVYYNDAGFPVGISSDATPEQILEQFVNDKNAWTTATGVSAHGLPPEAVAVLMQDGDLQGLSDLLVENNLILAQGEGGYILISGSESTTGFHTSLDQDALLNLEPPSNERIVPPPTFTDPALDPMDTSEVSPEIRDILLDVQETPETPLETDVEVDPFEYEQESIETPEPPPEPEPVDVTEPVDQQDQQAGDAGTASPSPDPTTQPDPSFTPAPTPAPQPAPAPAPAPAPSPQEEAPITTGMFEEYFPEPAPEPYQQGSLVGDARALIEEALRLGATVDYLQQNFPQYSDLINEVSSQLGDMQQQPSLTVQDVESVVNNALSNIPAGTTPEEVTSIVNQAISNISIPEGMTEDQVSTIVNSAIEAIEFPQGITTEDVNNIVSSAISSIEFPQGITSEEVEGIVNTAISNIPAGTSPEQVQEIVNNAIGGIEFPEGMTEKQVSEIVNAAIGNIEFPQGITSDDVSSIVDTAIANIEFPQGITSEDVEGIVNEAIGNIPAGTSADQVQQIVDTAIGNIQFPEGMTPEQVQEIVNSAIGNIEFPQNLTVSDVSDIVSSAISNIEFPEATTSAEVADIVQNILSETPFATPEEVANAVAQAGYATPADIGTALSQAGFATPQDIANALTNAGFTTPEDVATALSNAGYVTPEQLGNALAASGFATPADIESAVAGAGFATPGDIDRALQGAGFATAGEVEGVERSLQEALQSAQAGQARALSDAEARLLEQITGVNAQTLQQLSTVEGALNNRLASLGTSIGEVQSNLESSIAGIATGQEQATEERRNLQQAIIGAQGDIEALDENTRRQFEEFGGTVTDLFSDVNVDIEALQAGQISQAEAQQAFQQSTEERFGELGGQIGDIGTQLGGLASDVSGIGRGLEGLGTGIAGLGEGLGAGLLGLAAQQALMPGQIAALTPIDPVEFEKFQRGLTRRKLADPLRIGMFTGGARSV